MSKKRVHELGNDPSAAQPFRIAGCPAVRGQRLDLRFVHEAHGPRSELGAVAEDELPVDIRAGAGAKVVEHDEVRAPPGRGRRRHS